METPAFEPMWEANRRVVKGIVRRFAKRREDREDLEQEARARAWVAHPRCDFSRPYAKWLSRIVWCTCVDWSRARHEDVPVGLDFTLVAHDPSPLTVALRSETIREADRAFDTLTERQKIAVSMIARGERLKAVQNALDVSESAAHSLISHARAKAAPFLT